MGLRHFQERSAFYGIYECIAIPTKKSCLPRMRIVTDIAAYSGIFRCTYIVFGMNMYIALKSKVMS